MPFCFHAVAALNASRMPVSVSPSRMLDTSMAMTGVWSGLGVSGMVLSWSVVCPCCRMLVNSSCCSLFSCVVVCGGWKVVARVLMFFIVRSDSSMNLCGSVDVSSRVMGGKLYLVVVCVYCGC